MDLSFSRRNSLAHSKTRPGPDLAILLAKMAARQALSPTARREAAASGDRDSESLLPCKAGLFAPVQSRTDMPRPADASFNADAATMLGREGMQK